MTKMWAGRTSGSTDRIADDFNSSISFDSRMYKEDITGSIAHARMLGKQGIIPESAAEHIVQGLQSILKDLEDGTLAIDPSAEDIHMFVEQVLTDRIGEEGKMLHTARSRNDQVAQDFRMYCRKEDDAIVEKLKHLISVLCNLAEAEADTIMPGYTHLQRAQPITYGHDLMAYAMMFERDIERLEDCRKRINVSVIGSCALAGTTYDTDRFYEAEQLGFDEVSMNSIDGVSDRDFALELLSDLSLVSMHLSRFSEELVLYSSLEFHFIEFSDAYTTGSSIMPQKKNSDMAELIRGKCGRVYGDMTALFTTMKAQPLAYNKDMQEDKQPVFDAVDTIGACLDILSPMLETMHVCRERMYKAAQEGFINATDLADYLVRKGMPFRSAYKVSGSIVAECIEKGKTLEILSLDEYRAHSLLFDEDLYDAVDLKHCVERRTSYGGPCSASVKKQIEAMRKKIGE